MHEGMQRLVAIFCASARRVQSCLFYPYPQRTHILRRLGPKTLLFKAFGPKDPIIQGVLGAILMLR